MALSLGALLRDAVDGPPPGLASVVGEDPANLDLPALSARIRRRRRARTATRSAVGVVAAGAVALVGVHGAGGGGTGAVQSAALGGATAGLCGTDVSALPARAETWLVPPDGVITPEAGGLAVTGSVRLGELVGRRLVTTVVEVGSSDGADQPPGAVVLSRNGAVVAVGDAQQQGSRFRFGAPAASPGGSGTEGPATTRETPVTTAYVVSVDLVTCDPAGGTPPDGSYSVQYAVPGADGGFERAAGGPWTLALISQTEPPDLPERYPADEVPVVDGTVLAADEGGDPMDAHWTVRVAVSGDDGLARAADALTAAGADVSSYDATLRIEAPAATPAPRDQATLADLEAKLRAAQADVAAAQAKAAAVPEGTDSQAAQARLQAELDVAQAQERYAQATADLAEAKSAALAAARPASYRLVLPAAFGATTKDWLVRVSATTDATDDGRTVLTYSLAPR